MNKNVTVNVVELSKWGFKDQEGFVSLSKKLPEADKARLVPGATFEGEYYIAESGTRYLNKILGDLKVSKPVSKPVTDVNPPVDHERAKHFTPKFTKKTSVDNTMSKDEWAAKDQRISRQGVIQAAVIALAPVVSLEQLPEEAMKLAEQMLKFVNPS